MPKRFPDQSHDTTDHHLFPVIQDCGIESLVEELCVKLKRVQEERDRGTRDGVGPSDEDTSSPVKPGMKCDQHENPEAQAAKYENNTPLNFS